MHMHLNCKTNFNFYHVYISYGQTIFSDGEIYSSPYLQKQTVNLIFWERDIKVLCIGGGSIWGKIFTENMQLKSRPLSSKGWELSLPSPPNKSSEEPSVGDVDTWTWAETMNYISTGRSQPWIHPRDRDHAARTQVDPTPGQPQSQESIPLL